MPDENKNQETEVKDEIKETIEQKPEDKPFGFKIPEMVSKVLNKIKGSPKPELKSALDKDETEETEETDESKNKEVDEQTSDKVESPDSDSLDDEYTEQEIPYHLVKTARERGWSDDRIVRVAEADIGILEDLHKEHQSELDKDVEKEKPTLPKVAVDEDALKKLRENYGDDVVDKIITPLLEGQNKLIEQISSIQEQQGQQHRETQKSHLIRAFNLFNESMDKLSKDYPEFGVYDKLPKKSDGTPINTTPEFKVRSKVYDIATMFMKDGYPEHKAIEQAIHWYSGTQGEKRAERKIVTELNEQRSKHSPKPTAKKVAKQFRNTDEKKAAIIADAKEKAGIK